MSSLFKMGGRRAIQKPSSVQTITVCRATHITHTALNTYKNITRKKIRNVAHNMKAYEQYAKYKEAKS